MAKRFRKALDPPIRGLVRQLVREGRTRREIYEAVEDRFNVRATTPVMSIIRQEEVRQSAVDTIKSHPLNKKVDLHTATGCVDRTKPIQTHLTIHWEDPKTGATNKFWYVTTLQTTGKLSTILNKALREAAESELGQRYGVPQITSSAKSGKAYYRLEYVECV